MKLYKVRAKVTFTVDMDAEVVPGYIEADKKELEMFLEDRAIRKIESATVDVHVKQVREV